jgi:hypothetical protein
LRFSSIGINHLQKIPKHPFGFAAAPTLDPQLQNARACAPEARPFAPAAPAPIKAAGHAIYGHKAGPAATLWCAFGCGAISTPVGRCCARHRRPDRWKQVPAADRPGKGESHPIALKTHVNHEPF